MNLALNLDSNSISDIKKQTQSIVDNLIYLDEYKDCRAFVNFVNKFHAFTMMLMLLEISNYKNYFSEENFDLSYFEDVIKITEEKINEVKNYPHKNLKKKYLRIDEPELAAFSLFRSRYEFITSDSGVEFASRYKKLLDDKNVIFRKVDLSNCPKSEKKDIFIGFLYENYWSLDADTLNPIIKKYIKKAYELVRKYDIKIPKVGFEEQIYISSLSYRKALIELAK